MKEDNKHPIDILDINDPIEAIKFYMAEHSLKQRDLAPMIGSRSKVSEILSGKRSLTMPMARALHRHLGIPAEVLLKEPATHVDDSADKIDWRRFPLNEMAKRGWIEKRSNLHDHAEELVSDLMKRAGCAQSTFALYRKTDQNRANAKTDPYALNAWRWQVLSQSNIRNLPADYLQDSNPTKLMTQIAKISPAADGPRQAIDLLATKGIAVEIVEHLPRTHIDGAAMKSIEGRPVIGLTLAMTFRAISTSRNHTCGLSKDGSTVCWGQNRYGETLPPSGETFTSIGAGGVQSCGLRADGAAVCWGNDGHTPADETFASISAGYAHTCGLRANGVAVCWGHNNYGQSTPPSDETFVSVSSRLVSYLRTA